eukprot:CAMPEP_0116842756 /NCGR_PEP_ID=MMETSP0418-20121206/11697_1 /TAXON_ID=1158023 /ORGANISM="Astrosyne radiata, Strain 13vi08-1A" /LENGTH=221 /DNA_ID=CAMNT_0004473409 /DNA_START=251 /DNA_END=916 /DNA_ORIENTATION=-
MDSGLLRTFNSSSRGNPLVTQKQLRLQERDSWGGSKIDYLGGHEEHLPGDGLSNVHMNDGGGWFSSFVFGFFLVLVTLLHLDALLDRVLDVLDRNISRYPYFMKFALVRDLIKLKRRSEVAFCTTYTSGEFSTSRQGSSNNKALPSTSGRGLGMEATGASPSRAHSEYHVDSSTRVCFLLSSDTDVNDEWGHFADFQEEAETMTQASSLGTLPEMTEYDPH